MVVLKVDCTCSISAYCVCQETLVVYTTLFKQNSIVFQDRRTNISSTGLMHEVKPVVGTKTILPNELKRKCVVVHQGTKMYISPLCNVIESD